ncbi:hypothetical protein [Sporosarcina highlanderae]|uniref:DUF3168 domain-containing protein n=1 Tax=Sporosarcina highlanderae TaxID=3035916 RepID=A0ABT8JVC2_9BACL|nr:hypothetical protein [Sporosarcina highlanderae]MDN4609123.1 hypothetical protein [Sporosarcina highlanderae]
MNLNRKIMDTLKPLGVPVAFGNYNQTANTYIVFVEYNQASRMNADDDELITKHFFQMDVFSTGNYLQLVKDVKSLMKEAGFGRMFESETYDTDMKMFRKIIRFNYENTIGEI